MFWALGFVVALEIGDFVNLSSVINYNADVWKKPRNHCILIISVPKVEFSESALLKNPVKSRGKSGYITRIRQFFVFSFHCSCIRCHCQFPPRVSDLYPLQFFKSLKRTTKSNRMLKCWTRNKNLVKVDAKSFIDCEGHSCYLKRCAPSPLTSTVTPHFMQQILCLHNVKCIRSVTFTLQHLCSLTQQHLHSHAATFVPLLSSCSIHTAAFKPRLSPCSSTAAGLVLLFGIYAAPLTQQHANCSINTAAPTVQHFSCHIYAAYSSHSIYTVSLVQHWTCRWTRTTLSTFAYAEHYTGWKDWGWAGGCFFWESRFWKGCFGWQEGECYVRTCPRKGVWWQSKEQLLSVGF